MSDRQYGPSIQLTKLWEKVSAKGTRYFVGPHAGAKVTVLPNRDKASDADADWVVLLSQAEPYTGQRQTAPQQDGQQEPANANFGDAPPAPAAGNPRPYQPQEHHRARRSGTARRRYSGAPAPEPPADPIPF